MINNKTISVPDHLEQSFDDLDLEYYSSNKDDLEKFENLYDEDILKAKIIKFQRVLES